MVRALWCSLVVLLAPGCEEKVKKPEPPDVSALTPGYFAPDGVLTDANAADVVLALESKLTAGGQLCGWTGAADLLCAGMPECPLAGCAGVSFIFEAVEEFGFALPDGGTGEPPDGGTPEVGGIELRGDGYVQVRRICPGRVDAPEPDEEANGRVDLTLGFTDEGIDPVVWGDFTRCRFSVPLGGADIELVLDGNINIILAEGPWLPSDGIAPILNVDGSGTVDGSETSVSVDFQIDVLTAELATSVAIADGSTFLFFVTTDRAGFRTAEGEWTCDFGGMTCTDGTRSVSW